MNYDDEDDIEIYVDGREDEDGRKRRRQHHADDDGQRDGPFEIGVRQRQGLAGGCRVEVLARDVEARRA